MFTNKKDLKYIKPITHYIILLEKLKCNYLMLVVVYTCEFHIIFQNNYVFNVLANTSKDIYFEV
jgi:hypothetical protein